MKLGIVFRMGIGRSKYLFNYLVVLHLIMMVTIISLQLSLWGQCLLVIILSLSFVYSYYRYLRRTSTFIARDESGLWHIEDEVGGNLTKLELKKSFVTVSLVILYFKTRNAWQWRSTTIVIFADAVEQDLLRKLRVYLRSPKTFQQ